MRIKFGLTLGMLVGMAATGWSQGAAGVDAVMGAALHEERATGNLRKAIDGYRKVLATKGVSRAQAARAQYHIGLCYEKLGNQDARRAFESVVRNYEDQKDVVAQARARLASLAGAVSSASDTKLLWDGAKGFSGTVTADGRYMSAPDFSSSDVIIRDLVSGTERRVTNYGGAVKAEGEAESSAISPDGKRIAFAWDGWDAASVKEKKFYQVRVISADGTGERTLWKAGYAEVFSWSPDGKWIAASVAAETTRDSPAQLILLSPDSGEQRILRTKGERGKAHVFFSPDGKWIAWHESLSTGAPPSVYVLPADGKSQSETEIAKGAQMMGWSPDGSSVLISRERGTESLLFLAPVSGGKATGEPRQLYTASNVSAPLGISSDGRLFYRSNRERADGWLTSIDLKSGRLMPASAPFSADKAQLRMNDNALKFSPDGKQVLWVSPPNRVILRSVEGENETIVTPHMTEVRRVEWSHDGKQLLIAGTGRDGRQGLYRVNPGATGAASFVTGGLGLDWQVAFTPSRDGRTLYFRTPEGKLAAYSTESGSARIIFEDFVNVPNLSVSHNGKSLAIRSGGKLGVLDLASGEYRRLYTRDFATDRHVMWGLDWSADDRNVVVIAKDYTASKSHVWIFPVDGAAPIKQPTDFELVGISISPDGRTAATVRVDKHQQVWSLQNFLTAAK